MHTQATALECHVNLHEYANVAARVYTVELMRMCKRRRSLCESARACVAPRGFKVMHSSHVHHIMARLFHL